MDPLTPEQLSVTALAAGGDPEPALGRVAQLRAQLDTVRRQLAAHTSRMATIGVAGAGSQVEAGVKQLQADVRVLAQEYAQLGALVRYAQLTHGLPGTDHTLGPGVQAPVAKKS